jgi:hypothetical protein
MHKTYRESPKLYHELEVCKLEWSKLVKHMARDQLIID